MSEDISFLHAICEAVLVSRVLIWPTRFVVLTRLPAHHAHALLHAHWSLKMMNALLINLENGKNLRCGVYVYLPYSPPGGAGQVVQVGTWTPADGLVSFAPFPLFSDKYSNFHGGIVNITALNYMPGWGQDVTTTTATTANITTVFKGSSSPLLSAMAHKLNFSVTLLPSATWDDALRREGRAVDRTLRILLAQDLPGPLPAAPPYRLLLAAWMLFALVFGAVYLGNLTAALTIPKYPKRIESLRELVAYVDSSHRPLRRFMLPLRNTSFSKFLAVRLDRFGLMTSEPMLNSRSTAAEEGTGVLYLMNRSTQICLCSMGNMSGDRGTLSWTSSWVQECKFFSSSSSTYPWDNSLLAAFMLTMSPYGADHRDSHMASESPLLRAVGRLIQIVPNMTVGLTEALYKRYTAANGSLCGDFIFICNCSPGVVRALQVQQGTADSARRGEGGRVLNLHPSIHAITSHLCQH
ncbi:hypothetical protein GWK47_040028 [Chionoecetes opilio]|uniref:Ionotropic glutamate receptor C-terminal domain-containing protein n=1 Tax=Chionoecetes opilio TaxID=41210 RepID=A0A8J4YB20_CHIOP|nr:hypothetical protein GWK47_040028 [Chionoecetes opilio]